MKPHALRQQLEAERRADKLFLLPLLALAGVLVWIAL